MLSYVFVTVEVSAPALVA